MVGLPYGVMCRLCSVTHLCFPREDGHKYRNPSELAAKFGKFLETSPGCFSGVSKKKTCSRVFVLVLVGWFGIVSLFGFLCVCLFSFPTTLTHSNPLALILILLCIKASNHTHVRRL